MRIQKTKVYKFDELSEQAKQKAIEKLWDVNVDYEWWDLTYEDAERIGLKISEFDLGRASYVKGDFMWSAEETAEAILKEHGEHYRTLETAKNYLAARTALVIEWSDGKKTNAVAEGNELAFDYDCDELDNDFLYALCEDYRIMLQNEYDYLTSEEQIIEAIQANEYEFTEDGEMI